MKKKISILILVSLVIGCVNSLTEEEVEIKNDLTENNLNGNVKSINEIAFKALEKFGEMERGERIEFDSDLSYLHKNYLFNILYNKNGFITKTIISDLSDDIVESKTKTYDINNNLLESKRYNSENTLISRWTTKYDSLGNEIEVVNFVEDGSIENKYLKVYDSLNNLVEVDNFNTLGELIQKSKYEYNNNNTIISNYNPDGSLLNKIIRGHDSLGNLITYNDVDVKGKLQHTLVWKYDSIGNENHYLATRDYGNEKSSNTYVRDDKGNTIEEQFSYIVISEKVQYLERYKKRGETPPSWVYSLRNGSNIESKTIFKYAYDSVGNWIEKIKSSDYEDIIYVRNIEYYN